MPETERETPMPEIERETPMPEIERATPMPETERETSMPEIERATPERAAEPAALERYFHETLRSGAHDAGIEALRMLGALAPRDAFCAHLHGLLLQRAGRLPEALVEHERAARLDGGSVDYLFHVGDALCRLGRFEEARPYLQRVVALDPRHASAWHHLGAVFAEAGKTLPAEHAYRHCLTLEPAFGHARYGLACALLRRGRWREGWEAFEARAKPDEVLDRLKDYVPEWRGEPIAGKRVVVVAEPGHGDAVLFARFLRDLRRRGADVHLWAPFETIVLLARMPEVRNAVMWGRNLPAADYHAPLLSLPRLLGAAPDAADGGAYLHASPERGRAFEERLGPRFERLRVGVVWTSTDGDPARSAELRALAPLFRDPRIRWVSLNADNAQIAGFPVPIEDLRDELETYDDLAALTATLDGVVGVCSDQLHVAGALGLPVLALLSRRADWRWGEHATATPWYPRATLIRQVAEGDWGGVAARARVYLAGWRPRAHAGRTAVPTVLGETPAPREAAPTEGPARAT